MGSEGMKILFVCLGNTCRSPMAEAIFKYALQERGLTGWVVDSAAIADWHRGKPPNPRTMRVMRKHNIPISHTARQIRNEDFLTYDVIFGMDLYNMMELECLAPRNSIARLEPFGAYDPKKELQIRDPYCDSGMEGFEKCYEQCVRCTTGFLDIVQLKANISYAE